MSGQSGCTARERRDAHAQLQVRHAARAAGCQTKTCHRQTSIVPSQWCVSVSCVLSRVSWPTAEQRDAPTRGQETVSRSVCQSVCLASLLVTLSLSRSHSLPINGPAVSVSTRSLVRATSAQETVHYGQRRTRLAE